MVAILKWFTNKVLSAIDFAIGLLNNVQGRDSKNPFRSIMFLRKPSINVDSKRLNPTLFNFDF